MYLLKQRKDCVIDESEVKNKSELSENIQFQLNIQLSDKRKQKIIE